MYKRKIHIYRSYYAVHLEYSQNSYHYYEVQIIEIQYELELTSKSSASKGKLMQAIILVHTGIKISFSTGKRRSLYFTIN